MWKRCRHFVSHVFLHNVGRTEILLHVRLDCSDSLVVEEVNGVWKLLYDNFGELVVSLEWVVLQIEDFELFELFQLLCKVVNLDNAVEINLVVSKVHLLNVDVIRVFAHDAEVSDLVRVEN